MKPDIKVGANTVVEDTEEGPVLRNTDTGVELLLSGAVNLDTLIAASAEIGEVISTVSLHRTTIDSNVEIPADHGTVIAGPITGDGSITGDGRLKVV